jgi:hypothetical protein
VVRLGEGNPVALSPDNTRVLVDIFNPRQIVVYPVGPGEPIRLNPAPLENVGARAWRDGKHIILCGNEPSHKFRCYQQDLVGGSPTPIAPEGLDVIRVSPDGRSAVVAAPDRTKQLLSLDDGSLRPLPGMTVDDEFGGWSSDGRSIFVQRQPAIPARVERVDVMTGETSTTREVAPADRAGLISVFSTEVLSDGEMYTYNYWKRVSRLFVVKGVHY